MNTGIECRPHARALRRLAAVGAAAVLLGACANAAPRQETTYPDYDRERQYRYGSLTGSEGIQLFGGGREQDNAEGGVLGVNSFLWRATLDTLSFMPIASADPFGGVIITDWYQPGPAREGAQDERFKVNAYILGRQLRADGVRVGVFRQVQGAGGQWADAAVAPETVRQLEDAILHRARELRVASNAAQQ